MKRKILCGVVLVVITFSVFIFYNQQFLFRPTETAIPEGVEEVPTEDIEIIAQNLSIPWDVVFLPDGDILVSERTGSIQRIGSQKSTIHVPGAVTGGEGGLLGITLHPDFKKNNYLYVYYSYGSEGAKTLNKVERFTLVDNQLTEHTTIIDSIPGAQYHDGGRIRFGPDGYLYITTGDAGQDQLAQQLDSLAGKILRVTDDGSIPEDNPFDNEVYSYGHRNPQGLAWDEDGNLWSTEHGRSGVQTGFDELNKIVKGGNYGWPLIEGGQRAENMITPVAHSGPNETWAPASLIFYRGSLWFGGLRGQSLYQARIEDQDTVDMHIHLREEYGRLRTIVLSPNSQFYITTSNTDGRANPKKNDDKLLRINPLIFFKE